MTAKTPQDKSGGVICQASSELPPSEKGTFCILFYFNEVLIELKLVLSVEPRPFTAAMIASAIPAAIKPYSIAVAPD